MFVMAEYSLLNYKDGLAVMCKGKIARTFLRFPVSIWPVRSWSPPQLNYSVGDKVVLTGWSVGERYWGGYTQRARLQARWLTPLPAGLGYLASDGHWAAPPDLPPCRVLALENAGLTPAVTKPVLLLAPAVGWQA
ncbi:MAG: hypothetical protein R3F37_14025 [Candidatus Competibacteraceae bacterium]